MKKRLNYGQSLFLSHPHLFKGESLTPGITAAEYAKRRKSLISNLPPKSVALIPGYGLRYSTQSIFYQFHQQTDLFYLSGFNQPNCALLIPSSDTKLPFTMYVQEHDQSTEIWDGPRAGLDGAENIFNAEKAFPIKTLETHIRNLHKSGITNIYTNLHLTCSKQKSLLDGTNITSSGSATHTEKIEASEELQQIRLDNSAISEWLSLGRNIKVKPLGKLVDSLRVIKSREEIEQMRESGRIAGRAIAKGMQATKPGFTEHQLWATMEYYGKMQGATGLAYVPVVAGGTNALTLHYVSNTQVLKDGDLVLVDCGVENNYYASDISRTWPVNGKFTVPQAKIYQLILNVQKSLITRCKIGETSLDELQDKAFESLQSGLSTIFNRKISYREMNKLYPHHVGHYLGLDVHDTSSISRSRTLEEGMVITIEPGLYIPDEIEYGEYRGIGIRIEDDVAITRDGPLILTVEAPKEIVDIEAVMAGNSS